MQSKTGQTNPALSRHQGIHNGHHMGSMDVEVVSKLRKRITELETALSQNYQVCNCLSVKRTSRVHNYTQVMQYIYLVCVRKIKAENNG